MSTKKPSPRPAPPPPAPATAASTAAAARLLRDKLKSESEFAPPDSPAGKAHATRQARKGEK